MAWIDEANKHTNFPSAILELDLDSGTRKYSIDFIRPTNAPACKGNILLLPSISNSIGDILRTLEFAEIVIEFDDTDYEFRTIVDPENGEGLKNRAVRIKIPFVNISLAAFAKTIFKGKVSKYLPLHGLRFQIICEQNTKNLGNQYPDKTVEKTDYPNAPSESLNQLILEPYGTISDHGVKNEGAWGCIMIDDRIDAEKHLVGRQTAAITVNRVYVNKVLKVLTTDYTISTQVIDGHTHTEIHWVAGVNPLVTDVVSCDIQFGSREVCEAWKHYNENFCDYVNADFDAVSYAAANAVGVARKYIFSGAFREQKELVSHRDDVCREFELDIWWDPKDGLVHFKYQINRSSLAGASIHYRDYLDILEGYTPNIDTTQIINYQKYGLSYDYARNVFRDMETLQDIDSQAKHGATYKGEFLGFYFIRDPAVAADIVRRKLMLRKDPIVMDTFPLPLKGMNDGLGDMIEITHFDGLGDSGYDETLFQIRKTNYDLDNFVANITALNYSNFLLSPCILGDRTTLPQLYTAASPAERAYCYLCDRATGQFSNGDAGKQLPD